MTIQTPHHICDPGRAWAEYDARGIYLCRVCPVCVESKLAEYRPEVLSDSDYEHDEPISDEHFDY